MRPDARTMASNTSPTACSALTPSASRAPPECQMPTTGSRSRSALSMASTMCRQPSTPIAPPITVASVQNAIAGLPCTVPRAYRTPEASRGMSACIDPSSNNRSRRSSGSRGSAAVTVGAAWRVVTGSPRGWWKGGPRSRRREDQGDVVPAEAEGVVDRGGHRHLARLAAHDVEGLDGGVVVRVVEVGGGRHDLLAQGEDREDRLQRPRGTEQVPGLTLRGADQHVLAERAA